MEGLVLEVLKSKNTEAAVKKISGIGTTLLATHQIETLHWMSERYFCSLRQALRVWLPAPPWRNLLPEPIVTYGLNSEATEPRGKRQLAVVEALRGSKELTEEKLRAESGASVATLRTLLKAGVIECFEVLSAVSDGTKHQCTNVPKLTPEQQKACDTMQADSRPSLLFGVTGSGKTALYQCLIADCLARGKQAILLLPEIFLTENFTATFVDLVGEERLAIWHSRLTIGQRRETWRRIHRGEISLVLGSRSALFTPLRNLGLVILDEEHEWTYKNEQMPRYHARPLAEKLCSAAKAKLVLGTATPSLESWDAVKKVQFQLVRLDRRYGNHALPNVRIIDLADVGFGEDYPFSPTLLTEIGNRLDRKEQSILFLNRRGLATALLCLDCRRRVTSPESQLPFTVHRRLDGSLELQDHSTGLVAALPERCPHCNSERLHAVGAGTQRIETIVARHFPKARLLRADRDTLMHPEQMRTLLQTMKKREADILLGTQSVVKGLDLPSVTLAAVLLADVGLSLPHFRAGERIFQLLTQLAGRSGRSQPGDVIFQTFRPSAPEVKLAAEHQVEAYLEQEMRLREYLKYPPATEIIRLLLRGPGAATKAKALLQKLHALIDEETHVHAAPTFFGGGKEWHILIRGKNPRSVLQHIDLTDVIIDVDPLECL